MKSELESLCVEGSAIWEAIEARLDGDEHRGLYVAPLAELLDEVRKRVDDETWSLVLQIEQRAGQEVMAGAEIGLEMGYERGRATALLHAQGVPGTATSGTLAKLADQLADPTVDYPDLVEALIAALQAMAAMARSRAWPCLRGTLRDAAMQHALLPEGAG